MHYCLIKGKSYYIQYNKYYAYLSLFSTYGSDLEMNFIIYISEFTTTDIHIHSFHVTYINILTEADKN